MNILNLHSIRMSKSLVVRLWVSKHGCIWTELVPVEGRVQVSTSQTYKSVWPFFEYLEIYIYKCDMICEQGLETTQMLKNGTTQLNTGIAIGGRIPSNQ